MVDRINKTNITNWIVFFKERVPLAVYSLLSAGFVLSGLTTFSLPINLNYFAILFFGLLLFFVELRLMDEVKDLNKDIIANPDRPLPQKLLDPDQVKNVILFLHRLMYIFVLVFGFYVNVQTGLWYWVITFYLGLMYKEFYIGEALEKQIVFYGLTHQIIIVPICIFAATGLTMKSLTLGFFVLGSFFSYEICRKLDPKAHPILRTYLSVYGPKLCFLFVLVLNLISAAAAYKLGLGYWAWVVEGVSILSFALIFFHPHRYKIVELVATLSLLAHIWGYYLEVML